MTEYAIDSRGYKYRHGTTSGYTTARCRCAECTEHHRQRRMQYRKMKAYGGLPELYVEAQPVREHVWNLRNSGFTVKEIAMLSGVGINAIMNLTTGRPKSQRDEGRLPKELKRVSKVNAERLLSLSPKGERNE